MTKNLTEYQKSVLNKFIPDGWFYSTSLSHAVHGPDGLCRRLVEKGALESKSACPDGVDFLEWFKKAPTYEMRLYRKTQSNAAN